MADGTRDARSPGSDLPGCDSTASDSTDSSPPGPHAAIPCRSLRERFTCDLFDRLWWRYRQRVPYAASYEQLIAGSGDTFQNDHIAFRTLGWQSPYTGIASLTRLFDALGYRLAGTYDFPEKHLTAVHMAHPVEGFPLLFISELKCWELSVHARRLLADSMNTYREPASMEVLSQLTQLDHSSPADRASLLDRAVSWFEQLPTKVVPERAALEDLNRESQYAAWVLVHGFAVNHFTALVNSHQSPALDSLEKTVVALREAGVPMKDSIEGAPGSRLRQTATAAATVEVLVVEEDRSVTVPWPYAYFELAERGTVCDAETGAQVPFRGFLGPQATHLFEMTRKSGG